MVRRALVIGINRYPYLEDSKGKPQHLTYPAGDAEEIGRVLSKYGRFEVTRLPETFTGDAMQVDKMGLVHKDTLEREISQLFNPTDGEIPSTALLFFAGHGLQGTLPPNEEVKGYLATSETDNECEYAISFDWLFKQLIASQVRNQIVWLDCCHSGEFIDLFAQAKAENRGKKNNVNRLCIAACRESEIAYSGIKGHGLLTSVLLKGLDPDQNIKGNWITSTSLNNFVHTESRIDPVINTFRQQFRSNCYGEQIDFWQTSSPADNLSWLADRFKNSSQFLSDSDLSWFYSLAGDKNIDETIRKAYQDSLPPDSGLWSLNTNNIKQILQILKGFRRLPQFLNHLIQDERLPEEIRGKLNDLNIEKMLIMSRDYLLESY
ncbi:MAG: caspase family protein, partial [Planktothrix sp.]